MSREFPNQDPYLPPGVSPNDPHFQGGYEPEIDIDYAKQLIGWLEEAEGTVEDSVKMLVSAGEYTSEMAEKDMKLSKEIAGIRDLLEHCVKFEEQKINGEYEDYDADFAYESWRDDNM